MKRLGLDKMNEAQLRAEEDFWPKSSNQLMSYIQKLLKRQHDYGTCVYAVSLSACAAFNYAAHILGITGFQASCADLDLIRRTRRIDGSFIILKAEDLLYPQYDLDKKLRDWKFEQSSWLKEKAKKLLKEKTKAAPSVEAHWKKLASGVTT